MPVITTTDRASSARLMTLFAQAGRVSEAFGRSDLTDRLAVARTRLAARPLDVAVIRASTGNTEPLLDTLRTAASRGLPGAAFRDTTATSWAEGRQPDLALFVADASHEYGRDDFALLRRLRAAGIPAAAILADFDNSPDWQQVQQHNRRRLQLAELDDPAVALLPVSGSLCRAGLERQDESLLIASGMPQLFEFLTERLDVPIDLTDAQLAVDTIREVLGCLDLLAAERARQAAAAVSPSVRLEVAIAELDRRQLASTKWQLALSDGFADLVAAVDFDLRERLRDAMEEADLTINDRRTLRRWKGYEQTVRAGVGQCVEENYRFAAQRSGALARQVAVTLTGDAADGQPRIALPAVTFAEPQEALGKVRQMEKPKSGPVSARLINSLRGCYGGILMVGVMTSLAGMKLISTWSVGAGVVLGLFTFWEDKRANAERGRAEARVALSRFMDAVNFRVGEDLRTQLRIAHRAMRDHYTSLNDHRLRAAADAVRSAEAAAARPAPTSSAAQDAAAVADLRADLDAVLGGRR